MYTGTCEHCVYTAHRQSILKTSSQTISPLPHHTENFQYVWTDLMCTISCWELHVWTSKCGQFPDMILWLVHMLNRHIWGRVEDAESAQYVWIHVPKGKGQAYVVGWGSNNPEPHTLYFALWQVHSVTRLVRAWHLALRGWIWPASH